MIPMATGYPAAALWVKPNLFSTSS